MHYLGLALYAEGARDHAFLGTLLRRLCENLCAERSESPVEVGEVLALSSRTPVPSGSLEERVTRAALASRDSWSVLFLHQDGESDPDRTREERIAPAFVLLGERLRSSLHRPVAVVPVRETEAWALADGEALRAAFGTRKSDEALGVPATPREVERIPDPKLVLQRAYTEAAGGRRRARRSTSPVLEPIAQQVSLRMLLEVPAFQRLERDLREALAELRFVR